MFPLSAVMDFIVLLFGVFSASPRKLHQLATLPVNAPLWVNFGQQGSLAEAQLKYIGPLTRGSSSVYFGVQLKVCKELCKKNKQQQQQKPTDFGGILQKQS